MKFLGVIPARYGSSRLPGKPLMDICGHPMIEYVYKNASKSRLDGVVVATDDSRIYDCVVGFGGKALMTRADHPNGTSRIAEVCEKMPEYQCVINIQGDEPLINHEMIDVLIKAFENKPELVMATLKHEITDDAEIANPNAVKVVTDQNDYALYFSRSPIPYHRAERTKYYKHIGIYGYLSEFVLKYAKMPSTPLELSESLEQLRVLENGYKIKVMETAHKLIGVDTEDELNRVREYVKTHNIIL